MTEKLLIQLEEAGNCVPELLHRFAGNETICVTLVKKFPKDANYANFMSQVKGGNYQEAEQSIHTLKGVASNLSLTKVASVSKNILDILRNNESKNNLNPLINDLQSVYEETVEIIETN